LGKEKDMAVGIVGRRKVELTFDAQVLSWFLT
jgi:hypothetical protein